MSNNIDERIVGMRFDNDQFQRGVKDSTDSLNNLKKSLNLDGAAKGLNDLDDAGRRFSLAGITAGVEAIASKFQTLAIIGITALASITAQAVATGVQLVNSLTIAPVSQGYSDYETKLTSIQTVVNATGRSLEDVTKFFGELDTYADKTIYNLTDMTTAFAKFVNAGISLETAVPAIKGIANMVALAGQDANAAAIAFYNIPQSLNAGFLTTIDYKSLNLANVATKEFRTNLINAAVAAGTLADNADGTFTILSDGSNKVVTDAALFSEELSRGWAQAGILLDVLGDYGDITTDIGRRAFAAAQDVKSFKMMMETLSAAVGTGWTDTFDIIVGNLDESKALYTGLTVTIGGLLEEIQNARNVPLKEWKDLNGRTILIEAITNAFQALMQVFRPIQRAFQTIFPPTTGAQLVGLTLALRAFTESLKITGTTSNNIQRTFAGLFAVLDIGWTIIKQVARTLADLLGFTAQGSGDVLEFTARIGDWLVALDAAIKKGNGLTKFFDGLGKVIKVPITLLKAFGGFIMDLFSNIGDLDTGGFEAVLDRLKQRLDPLAAVGQAMLVVFGALGLVFKKVAEFFAPLGAMIGEGAKRFAEAIQGSIKQGNFDPLLDVVNTGLFGALVVMFKNFMGFLKTAGPGGIANSIKGIFGQLTQTLQAFQDSLKAKTLLTLAGAIALLTVSVVALSLIDSVKLAAALSALTVMFGQLLGAMAVFTKVAGMKAIAKLPIIAASLILFGIAIGILTSSVVKLAELDWNELARGLSGLLVLLGAVIGLVYALPEDAPKKMVSTGVAITILAVGIKILASAVTDLSGLSWEDMAKGLLGVGALLGAIVGFTKLLKDPKNVVEAAGSMILLGIALKLISSAVIDLSKLSWEDLAKGLSSVTVAMGVLVGALGLMKVMKVDGAGAAGLLVAAAALFVIGKSLEMFVGFSWEEIAKGAVVMAGALGLLAGAMAIMGIPQVLMGSIGLIAAAISLNLIGAALESFTGFSWEDIGKIMVVLAGSLLILAGAMALMGIPLVLLGSVGILAAAVALTMLAPALKLLGSMSWDEIGRGLALLASALGIMAVAGVLLIPAIPGLIGLGVAIALMGVGAALAGAGVLALSVGITALAIAGGAGIAVLIAAVSAFAGVIPYIAQQIGLGIVAMAVVIGENAPTLIAAFVSLLLAMLAAINEVIPPLVATAVVIITTLVQALIVLIPMLVDAGLQIITGILKGLADNIGAIAEQGYNIIIALITAMANKIPDIIDAAARLVLAFVNGVADAVNRYSAAFVSAGSKLFRAIIDGVALAIERGGSDLAYAGKRIGDALLQGAKNALGIHSPSREFFDVAFQSIKGVVNGTLENLGLIKKPAEAIGEQMISSLQDSLSGISSALDKDMDLSPTITPVLDLTNLKRDAGLMTTMLANQQLDIDGTYAQAAAASAEIRSEQESKYKNETKTDGSPVTVIFNQTNTSPKALSEAEIYRNTNNAISKVKEEIEPNAKQS